MGLLFMARPSSHKTRRQLVHCRIDVVTTRRNVVVNPSYLVQNSQTTRALSYICRDYSKKCRSKPVISRHYTVLCRSKSYGSQLYPPSDVWYPVLMLANPYDSLTDIATNSTNVRFYSNRLAAFTLGSVFKTTCSADVTYYPYDTQVGPTLYRIRPN